MNQGMMSNSDCPFPGPSPLSPKSVVRCTTNVTPPPINASQEHSQSQSQSQILQSPSSHSQSQSPSEPQSHPVSSQTRLKPHILLGSLENIVHPIEHNELGSHSATGELHHQHQHQHQQQYNTNGQDSSMVLTVPTNERGHISIIHKDEDAVMIMNQEDESSCGGDSFSVLPFAVEPELIEPTDDDVFESESGPQPDFLTPTNHTMDQSDSTQSMDMDIHMHMNMDIHTDSQHMMNSSNAMEQERNLLLGSSSTSTLPTFVPQSSQEFIKISNEDHSPHIMAVDESLNFSKLMREADGTFIDETTRASPFLPQPHQNPQESSIHRPNPIPEHPQQQQQHFHPRQQPQQQASPTPNHTHEAVINRFSSHCFLVSVALKEVSVREVMDVVSNPDLLRFWDESIDNLIVTDHKGGAGQSLVHDNSDGDDDQEMAYEEPDIEDFDDDMIVPPAKAVERKDTKDASMHTDQRQQYDGEWIEASTSEIIPPASHTNIVDGCVRMTRKLFGFGNYGSVSMFIERNRNQVSFTVGPFKAGISLSHKITVEETATERDGVILVDEVKIIDPLAEYDHDSHGSCSCFGHINDILSDWFSPSIEGYISQSRKSLLNLTDLIMRRSRYGDEHFTGHLIVPGATCADSLRTPLLQ